MVKGGVTPTVPVIIHMETPIPVVTNQPVAAPVAAINNVAQVRLGDYKKEGMIVGAVVGETLVGSGCTVGTAFGTAEIAVRMGATFAVAAGTAVGAGALVCLCTFGSVIATAGYCVATARR